MILTRIYNALFSNIRRSSGQTCVLEIWLVRHFATIQANFISKMVYNCEYFLSFWFKESNVLGRMFKNTRLMGPFQSKWVRIKLNISKKISTSFGNYWITAFYSAIKLLTRSHLREILINRIVLDHYESNFI